MKRVSIVLIFILFVSCVSTTNSKKHTDNELFISVEKTILWQDSSYSSKKLIELKEHDVVYFQHETENASLDPAFLWIKVKYKGIEGWVYSGAVSRFYNKNEKRLKYIEDIDVLYNSKYVSIKMDEKEFLKTMGEAQYSGDGEEGRTLYSYSNTLFNAVEKSGLMDIFLIQSSSYSLRNGLKIGSKISEYLDGASYTVNDGCYLFSLINDFKTQTYDSLCAVQTDAFGKVITIALVSVDSIKYIAGQFNLQYE